MWSSYLSLLGAGISGMCYINSLPLRVRWFLFPDLGKSKMMCPGLWEGEVVGWSLEISPLPRGNKAKRRPETSQACQGSPPVPKGHLGRQESGEAHPGEFLEIGKT